MLLNKHLLILLSVTYFGANSAPASDSNELPIVKTKNGDVLGSIATTLLDQRKFFSFQGIPYAKPPIGELRFRVSTSTINFNVANKVQTELPNQIRRNDYISVN